MKLRKRFNLFWLLLLFLAFSASLPHFPFYIPEVQAFTGANGEFGYWIWDGTYKILTIIANATANAGNTEANAYGFQDIVNAIEYYSWSAQYNRSQSGTQFEFSFRIVIGDGSTTTWFVDTNKQVMFTDDAIGQLQKFIQLKANAILRFGVLEDATNKITSRGVNLIVYFTTSSAAYYNDVIYGDSGSRLYLYSSEIISLSIRRALLRFYGNSSFTSHIYNSKFDRIEPSAVYYADIYNFEMMRADATSSSIGLGIYTGVTSELLFLSLSLNAFYVSGVDDVTVRNVIARNNTYLVKFGTSQTAFLVNVDSDVWAFVWYSGAYAYRQYEFDLTVTYPNGTAIQNANVTLSYTGQGGGTVGSWLTDSNGQISQQTLSMGFYNQTGGNTIYDYNPYNLTITYDGYQTYTKNFTLNEKTDWTLALTPSEGKSAGWVMSSAFAIGIPLILGIILIIAVMVKKH